MTETADAGAHAAAATKDTDPAALLTTAGAGGLRVLGSEFPSQRRKTCSPQSGNSGSFSKRKITVPLSPQVSWTDVREGKEQEP